MDIINIQAMKGGTGTTTLAVALASLLEQHTDLRIAVHTNKNHDDLTAAAGVPRGENVFEHGVMFRPTDDNLDPHRWDVVIVDNGHAEGRLLSEHNPHGKTHNIYLVHNDYLSLRRAVALPREDFDPNGIWVARINKEGALGVRDVSDVLNVSNVITLPDDPKIGRAVDAGVIMRRVPAAFVPVMDAVLKLLPMKENA